MIRVLFIVYCLLFIVCGCSSSPDRFDGTDEEREYDALQLKGKWEQIVEKNRQQAPKSLACRKVVSLARYRLSRAGTGSAPTPAVRECLADSKMVLSS